jgi:hypothetical protein
LFDRGSWPLSPDTILGEECLNTFCQLDAGGTTYILACVVEAQQSNNKQQAAVVLQRLLDKLNYSPAEGIHLPALLRWVLRIATEYDPRMVLTCAGVRLAFLSSRSTPASQAHWMCVSRYAHYSNAVRSNKPIYRRINTYV